MPNNTLKHIAHPFRHFPVTLGTIWLFTLLLVCGVTIEEPDITDILEQLGLFLFYFGSGSFFVESLFLHRKRNKWYILALTADLIAAVLFFFLFRIHDFDGWISGSESTDFVRYTFSYFLILFFLSVWLCYRQTGHSFEEYLTIVFSRVIRYHLIWLLLVIGSSIILGIMDTLFSIDAYWNFQMQIQMLLFGLYYMTAFLLSFYPEDSEEGAFTGVLVKYVLSGMVLIAFAVVYVYMLKILILLEIPSNSIFRITGQLFVLGIPVCLMASCYKENNPLFKAVRFLPYLFLPFLPLQIYSIGVRIWENGITPLRYVAVAFLLFECLFFTLYYFCRSRLDILLICLSAFILAGGCLPFINMNYVSYYSQRSVIDRFLAMTEEKQQQILSVPDTYHGSEENAGNKRAYDRIHGAYSFLRHDSLGEGYLDALSDAQRELLNAFLQYYDNDYDDPEVHYHLSTSTHIIPIEGYRRCYSIEIASYQDAYDEQEDKNAKEYYLTHYELIPDEEDQLTLTFDLNDLLRSYTNNENDMETAQDYFETHQLFEIDENHTLYLGLLSFTINTEDDTMIKFRAEGYLLEK